MEREQLKCNETKSTVKSVLGQSVTIFCVLKMHFINISFNLTSNLNTGRTKRIGWNKNFCSVDDNLLGKKKKYRARKYYSIISQ
jgi:hypothetical protein